MAYMAIQRGWKGWKGGTSKVASRRRRGGHESKGPTSSARGTGGRFNLTTRRNLRRREVWRGSCGVRGADIACTRERRQVRQCIPFVHLPLRLFDGRHRHLNGYLTMNESIQQIKTKKITCEWVEVCQTSSHMVQRMMRAMATMATVMGGGGQAQTSESARSHVLSAPVWGLPRGGEG